MAYRNLQHFIKVLEEAGELIRIKEYVDPNLEITEITDRVSKNNGPALLFENTGYEFPLLINSMGTEKRMAMALGVNKLDDIAIEIESATPSIKETPLLIVNNEITAFLAISAVKASIELDAKAIIADTNKGRTVRALAAYRGNKVIIAQCYDKHVMRELALSYGVYTNFSEMMETTEYIDLRRREAV